MVHVLFLYYDYVKVIYAQISTHIYQTSDYGKRDQSWKNIRENTIGTFLFHVHNGNNNNNKHIFNLFFSAASCDS